MARAGVATRCRKIPPVSYTHLDVYKRQLFTGTNPWAAVVEKVTTEFFEVELGWNNKGVSIASVIGNGSMAGVSNVTVEAPGFPSASAGEDCSGLPVSYTHLDVYKRQPLDPATGEVVSGQSAQDNGGFKTIDGVACSSATLCLGCLLYTSRCV